jgi:2-keto-3-deoxy-L-rhamnonate aldolase RhmA
MDHVREIAAVDGIDFMLFGPGDMAQELGIDMLGKGDDLRRMVARSRPPPGAAHDSGNWSSRRLGGWCPC